MVEINVPKLDNQIQGLLQSLGNLEKLDTKQQRALVKAGKTAGGIIAEGIQSEITDADQVFKIKRKGRSDLTYPGQLRRATTTWKIRGSKINIFVGMKRGATLAGNDGWFAWIVNWGNIGGEGNYSGPNKGFWERGVRKSYPAALQSYDRSLFRIIDKAIK